MAVQVNIAEAKAKLSSLLDQALAGEEVVIAPAGKPLARLTRSRAWGNTGLVLGAV
jgi:prevent-host-death family protein